MIAVSRRRSLYQRLSGEVKDRRAAHPPAAPASENAGVNLLSDDDPVVLAVRRGDAEALSALAASAPGRLAREDKDGWIPLHHAALCGQAGCLKALLRAHPGTVDKRTLQEQTALLLAVSRGESACTRGLLEAGADPDISDKNKETPLCKACQLENADMVSLILSHGATVNQRCGHSWTALHEAVSRDNTELCEVLVRAGAAVNPPNTYSVTPLGVAARRGHRRALCYLIGKGADVNMQTCDGVTALHEAAKSGHKEIVAALLDKSADANKPTDAGLLPLHVAAQYGHHEIVSLLLSVTSRARLRHSWISPLHLAAEHNRHEAAAVLLRAGADVNAALAPAPAHRAQYADGRATALCFAAAAGAAETAKLLLDAGAGLGPDPLSPLLLAVRRGCARTAALLLERGADVNARVPSHATAFPAAVALCGGDLPMLRCLLDHGCDALSCFSCAHADSGDGSPAPLSCTDSPGAATQFCEWISTPAMCQLAGPVVELLLEHVAHVRLCGKLAGLLIGREEWPAVRRKTSSPRPLLHLCRLRIRSQVAPRGLKSLASLPLPDRLIAYVSVTDSKPDSK